MSLHTPVDTEAKPLSSYLITLLRYGESQGNFEGRHQGQADYPLAELGRQQAKALVERWVAEKKTFDLVISSPLLRAREIAQMVSTTLHIPLELDEL